MTSQIQKLACEAAQLWDTIHKTDCELLRLRADLPAASGTIKARIDALQLFFDEASDRVVQIEDYLVTLSPACTRDAVVLLSIATAMAKEKPGERYTVAQHQRILPRILSEVLNLLERESGTTAKELAGDAFGVGGASWQVDLSQMVATLPGAFPSEPAHTA